MTYSQHVRAAVADLDLDGDAYTGAMAEAIEVIQYHAHEPRHDQAAAVCEFAFSQFGEWFALVEEPDGNVYF